MCCFILPDGLSAPPDRLDRSDRRPNLPCTIRCLDLEKTYLTIRQDCSRDRAAPPPRPPEDASRRWPVEGVLSVPRDTQITVYVDDEMKARLDERVEDSSETISSYANRAIEQRLQAEADDDFAREVRAEERIRELVSVATDEVKQATAEMRDLNAKTGAYAAANFELLKDGHKDAMRRDALSTGSRRMRKDLDVVQNELGGDAETSDTRRESGADASAADGGGDSDRKGPFERMREDDDVRE